MGVVSHSYVGLFECRDGIDGWYTCMTKPVWIGCMSGDAKALPVSDVKAPDHTAFQVCSSG